MLGKNNVKLYREKMANKFYRYSIKRLNIGVASVAVAVGLLFMGDASVVRAAANEVADSESKVTLPSSQDPALSSGQGQSSSVELAGQDKATPLDNKAKASQPTSPQVSDNQPATLPVTETRPASPTVTTPTETPKAEATNPAAPSADPAPSTAEVTPSPASEETLATTYDAPENAQPPVVTNPLKIVNERLEGDKNGQRYQDYFGGQATAGKTIKAVYIHNGVETPIGETLAESDGYWKILLASVKALQDGDKVRVSDGTNSQEVPVDSQYGGFIDKAPQLTNEKGTGNLTLASKKFYLSFLNGEREKFATVGAKAVITYPGANQPQEVPINNVDDKVTVNIPAEHLPLKVVDGKKLNDIENSGIEITYVDRDGRPFASVNEVNRESVDNPDKKRHFNVLDASKVANRPQIVDIYKISGTVYDDRNGDGSSTGDQTLSNIKVNLYNPDDGKLLASTTTDLNGNYTFADLPGYNSYVVKFEEPNRFATVNVGKQFAGTEKTIRNLKNDEVVDTAFRKIKHYEVRTETDKHSSTVETTPLLPKGVLVVKQTGHDGVNRVIYEQTRDVLGDEDLTEENFNNYYTKKNSKTLIERQDEVILEGTGPALPDLAIDVQTKPGEKDGKKGTYVTFTYPKYDQNGNKTVETKTAFIPDGAKGDKGAQGPQGQPGKDGGTPRVEIVKNEKNPDDPSSVNSYTIKITNPDGTSHQAVISDGKDGKSPEIDWVDNKDDTYTVKVKNVDGTTHSATIRSGKDGKDGLTPKVTAKRNDANNGLILTITPQIRNEKGEIVDGKEKIVEVKDGERGPKGLKGDTGERGPQGETGPQGPQGPKGDKGDTGAQGAAGANGKDGKNGVDGKSPEISSAENTDGSHTITIKNPNGTTTSFVVKNGEKGAQGPQGERGEKGEDGAQGKAGAQGVAGQDGLAPKVTAERNKANNGVTLTITPQIRDEKGNIVDGKPQTVEIGDGLKGDTGAAGENGKTFAPVVEKGKDGVTIIKFYPVNPETGKPDTSREAVASGEIKDGAKGDKGDKGDQGERGLQGERGAQGPQGQKGDTGAQGAAGANGKDGKNGADGKSPEISTTENQDGSHTITIKNPNGTTNSFTVKNGEKGAAGTNGKDGKDAAPLTVTKTEKDKDGNTVVTLSDGTVLNIAKGDKGDQGEAGAQGASGLNGKTFAPVLTKNKDGVTTIKFYPVNPETGKPDTSEEAVATGEIKDGAKGDKGDQGPQGLKGDRGEKGETGARGPQGEKGKDGVNGKSPEVSTAETKDGHTITIKNPDGSTTSFEVKNGQKGDTGAAGANGQDGLAPKVTAERNKANNGVTLTITPQIRDEKGNIVDGKPQTVEVKDGLKGDKGAAGDNGKTFAPVVTKDKDGVTTIKFYPVNPETGKPDTSKEAVATGEIKDGAKGDKGETGAQGPKGDTGAQGPQGLKGDKGDQGEHGLQGAPGLNGKSPEISSTENPDGTHTITIKNPNGATTSFVVKNGEKGEAGAPGLNGKDGKSPVVFAQRGFSDNTKKVPGTWLRIKNPDTLETTNNIFIPDGAKGEKGDQGIAGTNGKDGVNGTSPEISTSENPDGTHTITIKNPNGSTTSFVVKNGEKGEAGAQGPKGDKGDQGERGVAGDNGKSFAPVITKDKDGVTTIKFYPVNPETGKPDTRKEAVASGEIKDGAKGEPGAQGPQGEKGKDGVDGKSPEVSTAETKDGHTITIKNPDGSTTSFEVKNGQKGDTGAAGAKGQDGLAPKVTAVRNQANDGVTLTITPQIRDAKGKVVDGTPQSVDIKDGAKGEAGAQGLAGKDGLAPKVSAERNAANNGLTLTITPQIRDEKGNIVDGKPHTVEVHDGQKGDDGKSYAPVITKDNNGTTIKFYPVNPETGKADTSKEAVATGEIKDGEKGAKGDQGPQGLKGDQGRQGERGEKGEKGETGARGSQGEKGEAGAPGKDGKSPVVFAQRGFSDNTKKVPGTWLRIKNPDTLETTNNIFIPDGAKGEKGDQGERGLQGERGIQGAAGTNGKDGKDGKSPLISTKDNGDGSHTISITNPDGSTTTTTIKNGKDGEKGKDSATLIITKTEKDKDGNTVVTLSDGTVLNIAKGDQGLPGEKGAKGDKGDTGAKGPQGEKGEAGAPGKDGKSPVVFAQRGFSDNTKKVPGTWLRIKNPDTLETTNNIFIPDGAKGEKGDRGERGLQGERGEKGETGARGPQGERGAEGKSPEISTTENADGSHTITIKNPNGTTTSFTVKNGTPGAKGEKGDKGERGEVGPQGPKGDKGDTGAQGLQGERGEKGETGARGLQGEKGAEGKSPEISTSENTDGSHTITIKNSNGTTTSFTVKNGTPGAKGEKGDRGERGLQGERGAQGAAGTNGKDGKDGKSPTISTKDNGDGSHTITITNPDGSTSTATINDGKNGTNGKDAAPLTVTKTEKDKDGNTIVTLSDGTVLNISKGDKGDQGLPGEKGAKGDKGDTGAAGTNGKDGKNGVDGKSPEVSTTETPDGHTITIKNPDGSTTSFEVKNGQKGDKGDRGDTGAQGIAGADGKDGKSLTVTHTAKDDQGTTLVTLSDGTVLTIPKGDKGDKGERGAQGATGTNGKDGKDGKTYLPVVERTSYGNLIKFYPVNPETGKVDTTKEPVARAIVKDGLDGLAPKVTARRNATNDGVIITVTPQVRGTARAVSDGTPEVTELKDGKSPDVDVTTDANGNHVVTITKTNGKQKSVTITNGKDGKAPLVETVSDKDSEGNNGTRILVKNPDTGAVISESFVKDGKDGKDGKAPIVETKPGQDRAGQQGAYIIVKNPDTGAVISETFISDGKNGESPKVETTPATNDKGEKGHDITFTNPKTGQVISKVFVKDGKDGKDGQDGLTPDIKPVFDKNGKQIGVEISLTGRNGKLLSREFIYNGEDGQTPIIETEPSDNPKEPGTKIIYKNPKTGEVIRQVFVRDGKDGKDGRDGRDGKDAQGVEKITVNNNGDLVIINSNHTTQVIPRPNPNNGGIKEAKVDDAGHLIISLDDGRTIDAGLVRGKDGRDGRDGKDGKDGRGIKNVKLTDNGDFIVVYTDYSIDIVGNVCGTCSNPSKPVQPDHPSPDQPGNSEKPGKPVQSESPDKPSDQPQPDKPESSDQPGNPDKSGKHDQPGNPGKQDKPENPDKLSDQGDKAKVPEIPQDKTTPKSPEGPRPNNTEEPKGSEVQEEIPVEASDEVKTTSLHKKNVAPVKTYKLNHPKTLKASENAPVSGQDFNALPSQEAKPEVAKAKGQAASLPKTGSQADLSLPVLLAVALLVTGTGLVTISRKDESLQ
ncbi:collagen-flanked surface repeat-containing protein [Aerococcus mictus]